MASPTSVCTVVTEEFLKEFTVLAKTFRLFNPGIPIAVVASEGAAKRLKDNPGTGMEVVKSFSERDLADVAKLGKMPERMEKAGSHPPCVLYHKMEALKLAIAKYGDSVFLDADTVFLGALNVPKCVLAVSPRYDGKKISIHGKYNGGMVFCSDVELAQRWQDMYVSGEGFLDEGCLDSLAGETKAGVFGEKYNYGAWRKKKPNARTVSFHVHIDPERVDAITNEKYRGQTRDLAKVVVGNLFKRGIHVDFSTDGVLGFSENKELAMPKGEPEKKKSGKPVSGGTFPTMVDSTDSSPGYVVPFFNPLGKTPLARFCDEMFAKGGALDGKQSRSLVVEVAFGGKPFKEWEPNVNVIQLRSDSLMWQKEAMINIGIRHLQSRGYKNVGYLDCDVGFAPGVDWEAGLKVTGFDVPVQLTEFLTHEYEGSGEDTTGACAASSYNRNGGDPIRHSKAGFGWAFTTDWWENIGGLFDKAIVGGGDTFNWLGMTTSGEGLRSPYILKGLQNMDRFREDFYKWASQVYPTMKGNKPRFLKNIMAVSKPHGKRANRDHIGRHRYLDAAGYDPSRMVGYDKNGLLQWTQDTPEILIQGCAEFFKGRGDAEDDTPPVASIVPNITQDYNTMVGVAKVGNPNAWKPLAQ